MIGGVFQHVEPRGGIIALIKNEGDILALLGQGFLAFSQCLESTAEFHGVVAVMMAHALDGDTVTSLSGAQEEFIAFPGDVVFGLGGEDTLFSVATAETVSFGGSDNDLVVGSHGANVQSGGSGNDTVTGRDGDDILAGNPGEDTILGGNGDDVLIDSLAGGLLAGGDDNDTFVLTEAALVGETVTGSTFALGGDGVDTLYLVLSDDTFDAVSDAIGGPFQGLALQGIGLRAIGFEDIVVVDGRDNLEDEIGGESWYTEADLWGLV